ncbi:hypothetical protein FJZ17_03880 [Candidatus Pacearchaeota archaeon]|nr:hypothetical protein [Candidatus Pacearchaeota archaeon]
MKNIRENKKAQQEIVGFVIIVIIVAVVGVIFLGIYLKPQPSVATKDAEINNLLISTSKYTTSCYKDSEPNYRTIEDLVVDCYQYKKCGDGEFACIVLNRTYSEMLNRVWIAGDTSAIRHYEIKAYYQGNLTDPTTKKPAFFTLESGNSSKCLTTKAGQKITSLENPEESVVTELRVCFGS